MKDRIIAGLESVVDIKMPSADNVITPDPFFQKKKMCKKKKSQPWIGM
jgi:hypothetical protein